MMYIFDLTLTAGNTQSGEIITDCLLTYSRLKKVEIHFPAGCCGLVFVAIDRLQSQILPANGGAYFSANNETISVRCDFKLHAKPYLLRIRAYNTDDYFNHAVQVRFEVETPFDPDELNDVIIQGGL